MVHEDKNSSSNVLKVEAQVHAPPTTPSKWKRKSVPSPVPPPKPAPDESSGGGSRRKSSRISEKRQKEETQRMEDEIVVLEEEEKRSKGSKCKRKISDDSDDEIFVVRDKKKTTMFPAPQSKVKLASIFTKKAKLSKSETEARQKFLQSGVPEAIRRQTELLRKQEEILEELEYYSFPVINHVTQTLVTPRRSGAISVHPLDLGRFKLYPDGGDNEGLAQNKTEIFSNKLQNINDGALTRDDPRDQNGLMLNHSDQDWNSLVQSEEKERVKEEEWTRPTNVNKALSVLKKRVPSIEETSVFKQVAQSLTSTPSEERETEDSPLLLWSEKYKPESERDILGNRSSVDTLRSWLEARKKVQRRPLYSSSDEESDFMDDTNSSSQFSRKQNTAVLTGPPGCGKTCAVYALASQLGFKVIELNASCNRNGKRILSDLSEATQSHQVSHQSQTAGQITSFFGTKLNGPALFGTKPSGLTPNGTTIPDVVDLFDSSLEEKVEVKSTAKSKRKRKRKDDDVEEEDSDSAIKRPGKKERKSAGKLTNGKEKKSLEKQKNDEKKIGKGGNVKALEIGKTQNSVQNTLSIGKSTTNVGKTFPSVGKSTESDPSDREKEDGGKSMSIILIEDADIIFSDYDEGFVAALSSLVATSKRPLILVSNEERVGHLSKLMRGGSSLVLHFETPLYAEIGCFLQLVSVLEGIKLSQDKSLLLVQHNRGDIRKCLLALQYYVLSRNSYPSQPHPPWCASSSSRLTSLWWLWSSHYKLPPLIHNHTRTVLTRADQPLLETHEIGENSFTNPSQSSVCEPVRRNESRPGSVEDERIQESKYLDNDERKVSQENGVSKDETMEKELVDGSGVCVKPGKDSQESGYGSASSQQTPEPCQENQQSSQQNQQSSQKNQRSNQKNQQSNQENQQSSQKNQQSSQKNQQSSQKNQQSSQENQQSSQENQQISQKNRQSSQENQQLSQENQQSSQDNQKISNQEPGQPDQQANSSTGNGMDENVASLRAEFSRRFESWSQFQTEKSNMSQLSSMLSCFSLVDLMHRKLNLVSPGRDENPVPQIWQCRPNASSSLDNDVTSSLNDVTTRDLCASLLSCGRGLLPVSVEAASTAGVNGPYEETRRHTQQAFSLQRTLLSSFSPAEALSRRGFPLDHYTGLRSLARSETARHAASSKRYSRFFSHLKSVNIHLSQSDTERLCQVLWLR